MMSGKKEPLKLFRCYLEKNVYLCNIERKSKNMDKQLTISYQEYPSTEALAAADRELAACAVAAANGAYAPYSGFRVGAAVRLADGTVVVGSNQENIAYPSGLCAERTALFAASAQHPGVAVETLAVVGRNPEGHLCAASPCGACRQVMSEQEQRQGSPMRVLCLMDGGAVRVVERAADLLPLAFTM